MYILPEYPANMYLFKVNNIEALEKGMENVQSQQ